MDPTHDGPMRVLPLVRLRFTKEISRISVSANGAMAALVGRRSINVIGLTPPFAVARDLVHPSKAVPAGAEWCPHIAQTSYLASFSGSSVYVWNLNDSRMPLQATIPHPRNVRNIAWSLFDPNLLATCGADNAIHLWDMRDPRGPRAQSTFRVFTSGISSLKWNKLNANLLASAHDQQVEIWDLRRSAPVTFLTAHPTKITHIDWSPIDEDHLITSSLDSTVKLWNVRKSRSCLGTIQTGLPVSKGQYLPHGQSILVLNQAPAPFPRVWSVSPLTGQPILELGGAKDICTDFAMSQRRAADAKDVVAWSRDAHLCLWELPSPATITEASNSASGSVAESPPLFSASGIPFSGNSGSGSLLVVPGPRKSDTPKGVLLHSLREELDDLENSPVEGLTMQAAQVTGLYRQVEGHTTDHAGLVVALKIQFPSLYPHNAAPSFIFMPATELPTAQIVTLLAALASLCRRLTAHSQYCLRPALTLLRRSLLDPTFSAQPKSKDGSSSQATNAEPSPQPLLRSDSGVSSSNLPSPDLPCPRLSGAVFSPSGRLVHFTNHLSLGVRTHREMREALAAGCPSDSVAASEQDPAMMAVINPMVTHFALPFVAPIHGSLARAYVLNGDSVADICTANAQAAERFQLDVIARAWSTLAAVASTNLSVNHALGRPLVARVLEYFIQACDLQTVACMSRVLLIPRANAAPLAPPAPPAPEPRMLISGSASRSNPHRKLSAPATALNPSSPVTGSAAAGAAADLPTTPARFGKRLFQKSKTRLRTDSETPPVSTPTHLLSAPNLVHLVPSPPAMGDSPVRGQAAAFFAGYEGSPKKTPAAEIAKPTAADHQCLIAPEDVSRYVAMQVNYASLCLLAGGLLSHRAQLLHTYLHVPYVQVQPASPGLSFEPTCSKCSRNIVNSRMCRHCNIWLYKCSLCRIPVRGLYSVCSFCGHGGHLKHMMDWFATNQECASGCGCRCAESGLSTKTPKGTP